MGGKWLELLIEVAPPHIEQKLFAIPPTSRRLANWAGFRWWRRPTEWSSAWSTCVMYARAFAQEPNGARVVLTSPFATLHRDVIVGLAAGLRLSAIYPYRLVVRDGGLMSYGSDLVEQYRQAAGYMIIAHLRSIDISCGPTTDRRR